MNKSTISILVVWMLVIGGFLGVYIPMEQVEALGPTYVSGPISSDTTWLLADSPYIVTGDVTIDNDTTLTIEAGVTVKFDGLYSLIFNGTLNAIGTSGQPISFTSNQSTPAKSDWNRVRLQGPNNTMDYCEVSYGNYPLYIMGENTNNIISNCRILNNTGDGIYLKETTNNTIYNTTVSYSTSNGITLLISEYNIINSSYVRQNNAFGIYLRSSNNNTIESTNVSNNIGGGIELGLSSDNIQIKNVNIFENLDNGIDFNGNGFNNITDSRIIGNDGIGIDLGSGSEHQRIENSIIRDNGGSGIDLDGSSYVDIIDCNISENKGNAGIYSGSHVTNITIINSEIWNNSEDGLEVYGASYVNITYSNISGNALNGIAFNGSDIQENNIIQNCTIARNGNNGVYIYAYAASSTIYLQNNNIYSNRIHSNAQNGIYFQTYSDDYCYESSYIQYNNIFNNTIYLNQLNGIYFHTYTDLRTYSASIQYNYIYSNNIYSNNQNGIYFEGSTEKPYINIQYNTINNNNIYTNAQNGIHFYGNTWGDSTYIQYNIISNNTIYSNAQNGIFFSTNLYNDYSNFQYNNIYSNIIYLNSQNGIYFHCYGDYYSRLQYNNVHSNVIYSNNQNGIYFYIYARPYELVLRYNNIFNNTIYSNNQNGIYIYAYSHSDYVDVYTYFQFNNIYFNTIYSNDQNGIYIYGNSKNGQLYIQYNYIYSNTIYQHTNGSGIYARSDNNTVTWQNSHFYKNTIISNLVGIRFLRIYSHIVYINNISNNINDGILLNSSNSNTFSYNVMAHNNWCAINLTSSSSNNKIQNNNISSNNLTGIFVKDNSNYNTITRNDILNHPGLGVNITNSFDNYMHHNNFKNNAQHAYDSTTQLNDWDDSAEGNWWDDYTGFDANGDGIGDIPYDVPGGGSKDWYPIINPANITAPHVGNTTPVNGAVNVSVTPYISITFSNKMNRTATENAISISGGITLINFTWSNGDMTVTFEPTSTLSSYTSYSVDISITAKDVLENHLEETYQFSFTTKDVVPPSIILTSPVHNSIDITLNTNIIVTFSESMNYTTVTFSSSPDPTGWSVSWSNMDSVATYSHIDFGSLTTYTFEITSGKDIAGNDVVAGSMPNPWSFTTLDVVGPEITTTSPSHNSSGVLLTANVVITFSEQMNTSTVTYSCNPDPGGWSAVWSNGDSTVTYSHFAFDSQTIYSFQISAGKDIPGNTLNPSIPNPWSFTTIDATAPLITATSPSNASLNVPLNENIIVTFNEVMDNTTVTYMCNPNPGGWAVIWSGGNTVATYSHNPFSENTDYTFQITGGKDIAGNNLMAGSVPNPWFFTSLEFTAPQIITTSPSSDSIDIALNANIIATFSEAIDPSSLDYICSPDPGGWSESWSTGNTVITFLHNPFAIGTTYTFHITAAKDIPGNDLDPGGVLNPWSFTTVEDFVAPQISSISPPDNAVNVNLNADIIVTFSEAMDTTSINYICTPDPGGWFESWSDGDKTLTFSHNSFVIGTTYTFHITAGKDLVGNNLTLGAVPHSWNFTTISVDSLIVTPTNINITVNGTMILIAQAYDFQNNPITGITFGWSVNNNLGTVSPQGSNIVTFYALSNEGTCYVNVTAGEKSASSFITIKSGDVEKKEPTDGEPEDLLWIWFLIIVIAILSIINLAVALRKDRADVEEGSKPDDEKAKSEETTSDTQENIEESESSSPPEPQSDEKESPPPPDVEETPPQPDDKKLPPPLDFEELPPPPDD